ncbi:MAG: hypothetical protein Q9209_006528 [Squamulea sp. 1 TL-2023]
MASKRSRATFEADLQAQQSPYVVYGTPLPPLDPDTRDDGSYVPVWKQEVTDEQGRKRLHGAFTGGFSAGYFNTVGSKEGWTPSTFVSSRANKKKDGQPIVQQKPEDFMDDEDIADAEEAKKLQTAENFAGFGTSAEEDVRRNDVVMDIMKTTGETMGVKLLKRMGWREGQGIGPKVRRKAKLDEKDDPGGDGKDAQEMHLFAPGDSKTISLVRKNDRKGLGFEGEGPLDQLGLNGFTASAEKDTFDEGTRLGVPVMNRKSKSKNAPAQSGFGVGILNDDGSGDDDPYSMGPKISYNRVVGGDRKKKPNIGRSSANPLLNNKPVFISKKPTSLSSSARYRRCHDGRLPLDGFVLASDIDTSTSACRNRDYPPPKIPEGWKSTKSPTTVTKSTNSKSYRSSTDIAKASNLSPRSRAALLDEKALPGKSVFDFLTPNARSRLVTATKNEQLPPALSEATNNSSVPKSLSSLVPQLLPETALTALGRGTAGWMPYAEDLTKRGRYRLFLEIKAGLRPEDTLPERAPGSGTDDWVKEMQEFAHAAQIFKPMTGMMATRFTSSSNTPKLASDRPDGVASEELMRRPSEKAKNPAEEAAKVGMYGPITREIKEFYPTRLLCKRFNIRPPAHVQVDPGQVPPDPVNETHGSGPKKTHSETVPQQRLELVGKRDMDELMRERGAGRAHTYEGAGDAGQAHDRVVPEEVVVDTERNEALEKERPGEEVFRAIFGSDSEDE